MKRFKGSELEKIVNAFWVYFYTTDWGKVGMCGTSYGLGADMVLDFYFPENEYLDKCTVTAVEILMPS